MPISANFQTSQIQELKIPLNTNFRGTQTTQKQNKSDTVEIQGIKKTNKKKGLSNNAKIGISLGIIATIVGGLLLHKNFANKISHEGQQVTKELSQAVEKLIHDGHLSTKEAEMFKKLKDLDGDEFITRAYELIAKDMGLVKVPKLNIGHDGNIQILGHTGKDITIYPDNYPADNQKAELLGTLRHELEHYKQHLIIFLKKGDVAEQESFAKQMNHRISCQAAMRPIENGQQAIDEQLIEECHKYGFTTINGVTRGTAGEIHVNSNGRLIAFSDVIKTAYEHDTPIQTIRSITPCEWEQMHFTPEELAKADEYLKGTKNYCSIDWLPQRFFNQDGSCNLQTISENNAAYRLFKELGEGYFNNILERDALASGNGLRDKFKRFLEALSS